MEKIEVKIVRSIEDLPMYQTIGSAGCDLINNGKAVRLLPMDRAFIPTGIRIQLPDGYEAQVRGRSGLNRKYGLIVPVGTIDCDYRGEVGVVIYNLSREEYTIQHGDRIAQLVISPCVQADWQETDNLDESDRGTNGFGHSGK